MQILKDIYQFTPTDRLMHSINVKRDSLGSANKYSFDELGSRTELMDLPMADLRDLFCQQVAEIIPEEKHISTNELNELKEFYNKYYAEINYVWSVAPGTNSNDIFGYHLEDKLGSGMFSNVFLANDIKTGNTYAVSSVRLSEMHS